MSYADNVTIQGSPKARAISSLRSFIERSGLRAGDRLPAESKLAAQFDVSRMTLRSALDVLVREGVVRRERNLGCFCSLPAKAEEPLMARTVVLLTDHLPASDGQIFGGTSASIVSGVIDRVGHSGRHFLRVSLEGNEEESLRQLVAARPQGVILSCWRHSLDWQFHVLEYLKENYIPVVVGGDAPQLAAYDCVGSDHVGGTRQLVHALAEHGKKRILRLWTPSSSQSFIQAHDRGYEQGVQECGLPLIPAVYTVPVAGVPTPDFEIQTETEFQIRVRYLAGYLAEHMHSATPVDAIMVATDTEVLAVLAACRLFGRSDIAVTGYDNHWQSKVERQWEPGHPFATVEKHNHRLGEEMVELLLQRVAGELPDAPQMRLVEQQVVVIS